MRLMMDPNEIIAEVRAAAAAEKHNKRREALLAAAFLIEIRADVIAEGFAT